MLKVFKHVRKNQDPCEIFARIIYEDRYNLVSKLIDAYGDCHFKRYVDHVIMCKKNVSFLPQIESVINLECKDNEIYLILYPIMCPNKYMLLKKAYYILLGESNYSDEDAYKMLNYIKKPNVNLPETMNYKKKETQLSWINKYIISRMNSSIDENNEGESIEEILKNISKES